MSKEIYFLKKCRQNVGKRDRVGGKKSGAQEGTRTPTLLLEADFKLYIGNTKNLLKCCFMPRNTSTNADLCHIFR